MKHTEKSILKAVHNYFATDYKYCIKNSFIFRHDWESDYFCMNREGYSFEIEVKISKSDFKSDFKKEKHKVFVDKDRNKLRLIPNKFYYAVPNGLIKEEELPPYAGLIYVNGSHANIVKRAPFIHKNKQEFRKLLCDKFYYQWLQQKKDLNKVEYNLEIANNKIANLWINYFIAEKVTWEIQSIDYKEKKVVGLQQPYYDKKNGYRLIKNEVPKEFDFKDVKFK